MTSYRTHLQEHLIQESDVPVLLNLSAFHTLLSWQCGIKVLKVCRIPLQFRGGELQSQEVAAWFFFFFVWPSFTGGVLGLVWGRRRWRGWEQVSIWLAERTSHWLCDYRLIMLQWVAANGFFFFCRGLGVWHTATLPVTTSQTTHEGGVRVTHGWLRH